MAYASSVQDRDRDFECSICSEAFTKPKILKCLHTFCEHCIQSWILRLAEDSNDVQLPGIECPLCRKTTSPPVANTNPTEWAKLLPNNFALLTNFDSIKKGAVEGNPVKHCDPCFSVGDERNAQSYCVECKEHICGNCWEVHKKLKMLKDHTVIEVEQLHDKLPKITEYRNMFLCDIHPEKELEFYCYDDDEVFCATCAFIKHRSCDKVVEIKKDDELAYAGKRPLAMKKQIENCKAHINKIIKIREEYNRTLDKDIEELPDELKKARLLITSQFVKFEEKIIKTGRTTYTEASDDNGKKLDECRKLLEAMDSFIRNSEEVAISGQDDNHEYFIICRALQNQLEDLRQSSDDECSDNKFTGIRVYFEQKNFKKEVFAMFDSACGSLQQLKKEVSLPKLSEVKPLAECHIRPTHKFTGKIKGRKQPHLTSCAYLADERLVIVDRSNKRFLITDNTFSGAVEVKTRHQPWAVTPLGYSKIGLTFPAEKKIVIYDVDDEFQQKREIHTSKPCYAIEEIEDNEIAVTLCDKDEWSLLTITQDGEEIETLEEDDNGRKFKSFWNFKISRNSRVIYQPCQEENVLFAFDLDLRSSVFEYRHKNLRCPGGLNIDEEDNIYVCGITSRNIHVLSSEGDGIKIIDIPGCNSPINIYFSFNGEDLAILGNSDDPGPFLFKFKV